MGFLHLNPTWELIRSLSQSVLSSEITWCSDAWQIKPCRLLISRHLVWHPLCNLTSHKHSLTMTLTYYTNIIYPQLTHEGWSSKFRHPLAEKNKNKTKLTLMVIKCSEIQTETGQDGTCALCGLNETRLHILRSWQWRKVLIWNSCS